MSEPSADSHTGYDHRVDLEPLQAVIGYRFQEAQLLERAVIHRSYTNEHSHVCVNNQRLEYLGDAVLGLVVADELFRRFPEADEGPLSNLASRMVCETALRKIAGRIGLGEYLRLGRGESMSQGREKASNLSDAYEAVLAAIYLDGGLDAVRGVILDLHRDDFESCEVSATPSDHKSRLQRTVQNATTPPPKYVIVSESGPAHDKEFVAEVFVGDEPIARGEGRSKKEAEQNAASEALARLNTK